MKRKIHAEFIEEIVSQEEALADGDVLQNEYNGEAIWNGEKLVSQEEWDAEQQKGKGL